MIILFWIHNTLIGLINRKYDMSINFLKNSFSNYAKNLCFILFYIVVDFGLN